MKLSLIADSHTKSAPIVDVNLVCVRAGPDGKLLDDPSAAGQAELADLKSSLTDTQPAGALVSAALLSGSILYSKSCMLPHHI